MSQLKKLLNKFEFRFLISELVMILISTLTYKLCCVIGNIYVASFISMLFSLICNYFLCLKYVFRHKKCNFEFKKFVKFMVIGILILLFKQFAITKLYRFFLLPLLLSRGVGFLIVFIIDYYFKQSIFDDEYNISFDKIKRLCSIILEKWDQFINIKYIKVIFKLLPQNLFVFLFFLGSLYYMVTFFEKNDDILVYSQVVSDDTIPLVDSSKNIDFFDYNVNQNVDRICLVFGTYDRKNNSDLTFELFNDNKEVYKKTINTSVLKNASDYCLDTPVIKKEKIQDYKLKVIPKNATKKNSVALFSNKKTKEPTIYLKEVHNIISLKYLTIFVIIVAFLGINYIINKTKKLKETTFLLISLFYFGTFLIFNPPLEVPDEPSHFYSSYNLAQNGLNGSKVTNIEIPDNIECLNYSDIQVRDRVSNLNDVKTCFKARKNEKRNVMFGVSNKVSKSFLGHLFQAFSIKIIDIFTNSPVVIFYFARFGNFIVSFLILLLAIKICPKYKNVILFIGLTPMFIQQITSLSYDAILNSLSLLFVSYVVELILSKRVIKIRDIVIPCLFLIVMFTVKIVYVPLILFLIFIPNECFKNKKYKFMYYLSIILISLLSNYLVGNVLIKSGVILDGSATKNFNYILNNPLKLIPIAINTIQLNGWFYVKGLVGNFSWFIFALSDFSICCWIICLILLILSHKNILIDTSKLKYKKVTFLLSLLISIAGIFASMYFCWSTYKLDYVDGVQGRYFIPLVIFIALYCMPKTKKFNLSNSFVYSFCNIMLFQTVFYLITYFY